MSTDRWMISQADKSSIVMFYICHKKLIKHLHITKSTMKKISDNLILLKAPHLYPKRPGRHTTLALSST